jgi:hypothetical protein
VRKGQGVGGALAAVSIGFMLLFFGIVVFFRDAIGSVVLGFGNAIGIPGGSVLFGVNPFYLLELFLASALWFGGVALVDYFSGAVDWGDLATEIKQDAFFIFVLLAVFAVSGILTGFGLKFTNYRIGEGLLLIGTIATLRDIIRWVNTFIS